MATAFQVLSSGLNTCANKKNADQIEAIISIIKTFKDPKVLAIEVGHNILFNGVDIEKRIIQAVADYHKQDWLAFGNGMGTMLSEISIGTQVGAKQPQYLTEAVQITKGILKGAI